MKTTKTRKTWFYKCDGGVHPAHHHPINCSIIADGGLFEVWIGSTRFQQRKFGSMSEALGILTSRYDKVFLEGEKRCETVSYIDSVPVKDEPIKYRDQHPAYEQPIKRKKTAKKKRWFFF